MEKDFLELTRHLLQLKIESELQDHYSSVCLSDDCALNSLKPALFFCHQVDGEGQVEDQSGTQHCRKLVSFTVSGKRRDLFDFCCGELINKNKSISQMTLCLHFQIFGQWA